MPKAQRRALREKTRINHRRKGLLQKGSTVARNGQCFAMASSPTVEKRSPEAADEASEHDVPTKRMRLGENSLAVAGKCPSPLASIDCVALVRPEAEVVEEGTVIVTTIGRRFSYFTEKTRTI